jgi:hypothetical protein
MYVVTMTDLLRVLKSADIDVKKVSDGLTSLKLWK